MSGLPPFTVKDFLPQDIEVEDYEKGPYPVVVSAGDYCDDLAPVLGSSTIARAGWKDGTLKIRFKGATTAIWEYTPVNEELFLSFISSPSKGTFFAKYIKGNKHIVPKRIV